MVTGKEWRRQKEKAKKEDHKRKRRKVFRTKA